MAELWAANPRDQTTLTIIKPFEKILLQVIQVPKQFQRKTPNGLRAKNQTRNSDRHLQKRDS